MRALVFSAFSGIILTHFWRENRHLILCLPSVGATRNAEGEGEVVALDQLVTTIMALNHTEILHGFVTYNKSKPINLVGKKRI